jgi:hypothetical protein
MGGNWRDGFEFAYLRPDPEPDEGPGLTWRQLDAHHWSGSWNGKLHGTSPPTATVGSPTRGSRTRPALSPITSVGRFDTVDEAQVAADDVWASR